VKILYFAKVRESIGFSEENIDLPSNVKTVDDFLNYLISKDKKYDFALNNKEAIHIACDEEHVDKDFILNDTKEIAIFPPVTGG
jgi:molybdopterin synthase sulfur carrier subunit|tara:strand:- start:974 stop:1225 length:252 start_codon:yes stop_codon:yes gene_type:complete